MEGYLWDGSILPIPVVSTKIVDGIGNKINSSLHFTILFDRIKLFFGQQTWGSHYIKKQDGKIISIKRRYYDVRQANSLLLSDQDKSTVQILISIREILGLKTYSRHIVLVRNSPEEDYVPQTIFDTSPTKEEDSGSNGCMLSTKAIVDEWFDGNIDFLRCLCFSLLNIYGDSTLFKYRDFLETEIRRCNIRPYWENRLYNRASSIYRATNNKD